MLGRGRSCKRFAHIQQPPSDSAASPLTWRLITHDADRHTGRMQMTSTAHSCGGNNSLPHDQRVTTALSEAVRPMRHAQDAPAPPCLNQGSAGASSWLGWGRRRHCSIDIVSTAQVSSHTHYSRARPRRLDPAITWVRPELHGAKPASDITPKQRPVGALTFCSLLQYGHSRVCSAT